MSVTAVTSLGSTGMLPMAPCIPQNDLFTGVLASPIGLITGGLGALIEWLVVLVVVVLAISGVVQIVRTKRASDTLVSIAWVLLIPLVAVLGIAIYNGVFDSLASLC